MECHKVFYQPERVSGSLGTFILNLIESVIIVVVILMITMGFKSGVIIGISLVVTVFGSFLFLYFVDGTMQRVSLASFVLAMGMLVDNAIVIIDGILVDLKAGKSRMEAMTAIGRQTAMPLLGATLIAIIAFLPIFMSPDTAGVYTRDLFIVLAVSLLLSWVLALVHVPLMANRILHPEVSKEASTTGIQSLKQFFAVFTDVEETFQHTHAKRLAETPWSSDKCHFCFFVQNFRNQARFVNIIKPTVPNLLKVRNTNWDVQFFHLCCSFRVASMWRRLRAHFTM